MKKEPVRRSKARSILPAIWVLLRAAFFIATFTVVILLLIRHAERPQSVANAACTSRFQDLAGFEGDPDFYGLGIGLGIYLQWLTILITNGYLESDRQYVLMTYHIFSISISVALIVKIFASACTFSAEVFTVLVLFWGGFNTVQIPMMKTILMTKWWQQFREMNHEQFKEENWAQFKLLPSSRKLRWSMQMLNFIMSPVTIWYWVRIAAADGGDFASTPSGTAYFFFARVHGDALKPFSIFMAVASVITFLWFVFELIPMPWELFFVLSGMNNENVDKLSTILRSIVWVPLFVILWLPAMVFMLLTMFLMVASFLCISGLRWLMRIYRHPAELNREAGVYWLLRLYRLPNERHRESGVFRVPTLESGIVKISSFEPLIAEIIKYQGVLPFLIAVWCIIAVELTLHWNSISRVYDVKSTGQIIPLVVGISGLLDTLSKQEMFMRKSEHGSTEENKSSSISDAAQQTSSPAQQTSSHAQETSPLAQEHSSPSAPDSPHQPSTDVPHEGTSNQAIEVPSE